MPQTLAEAYASGDIPRPPVYVPPPEPPRRDEAGWIALIVGLFVFAFTVFYFLLGTPGLERLRIAVALQGPPPPALTVDSSTCERPRFEVEETSIAGLLNSATEHISRDQEVIARVRVRNNGGAGRGRVSVFFDQSKHPYRVTRTEEVHLEAGEEREMTFHFPEYVAGAEYSCSTGS